MIVFDLQCRAGGHVFEGWFSSSDDYEGQRKRKLLVCPTCNDSSISKAIMAPAVGAKSNSAAARAVSTVADGPMMKADELPQAKELRQLLGRIAEIQADKIKDSKWVGEDFTRQARAMDAGEIDAGLIHGKATPDEARDMIEDGIGVMPLLIPFVPPEELN